MLFDFWHSNRKSSIEDVGKYLQDIIRFQLSKEKGLTV